MYRLVALDVDGTILTNDHTLPEQVTAAIHAVQARGVQVTLATGKLFVSLSDLMQAFALRGPQITCNGAAICDAPSGRVLHHFPLDEREIALSLAALAACGPEVPIAWYTTDAIYTTAPYGLIDERLAAYHEPPLIRVAAFDATLPRPVKLLMCAEPARLDALRAQIEPVLAGKVRVVRTAIDFLECMSLGTTKGTALAIVMDMLGLSRAQTLAIGDSENDIPLLQAAGLGIAVQNAVPELRACAQAVTLSCDDAGVAHALDRWMLSQERAEVPSDVTT